MVVPFASLGSSSCCVYRNKTGTGLLMVLIGDEVGYILVEKKLYGTAKLLDGRFDLRCHLMSLDIQVKSMINQWFWSFNYFYFMTRCGGRFLL